MTIREFNKCVDMFSDNVYRFILKNIKDTDKAKDIVQDSFEKLWINRQSVDGKKVKSYLFSTAYHTMIDVLRREKKVNNMPEEEMPEVSHENQYNDLQEILHEAIKQLPEIQKSVVLLRDYEGYSYKEISDIVKISESQVKVYIYRARVFLKSYIGKIENVV